MGPGTAPEELRTKRISSASAPSFTTTMPPMMSEWPLRYLVVEWTTTSAPSSSGRWLKGEAKVLSTISSAPAPCAISAITRRSQSRIIGLVGVSTWRIRVVGRSARRTASGSLASTKVKSMPSLASTRVNTRVVPPYVFSSLTTWSPAASRFTTASIAASPDANATP